MEAVHDKPSEVSTEKGTVIVDGPGGVAVAFTPEAAAETADRLYESANAAFVERGKAEPAHLPRTKAIRRF